MRKENEKQISQQQNPVADIIIKNKWITYFSLER